MLGIVGLSAAYLVVGEAVLVGLGVVRSPAAGLRSAGLALFTGWTLTGIGLSLELVAGLGATFAWTAALWAAVVAAAAALGRAVPPQRPRPALGESGVWGKLGAGAGGAVLVAYLAALGARAAEPTGLLHPDVWNFWLPKAKAIVYFGGLDTGPGGFTTYVSPDYPPLDPALEAASFRFAGRVDPLLLPFGHWIVACAFFGAVLVVLAPRVRPLILWPSLAMVALTPMVGSLVGSSLGDEPLSMLYAFALLLAAVWLLEGEPRHAALCCVFLGATVLTKNEGLMLALALVLSVAVAALARGARRRPVVVLAAVAAAAFLTWRLWLLAHDVPSNYAYDFRDLFRPAYLAHRLDRLAYGSHKLLDQLLTPSRWLLGFPLALALGILSARRRSALAVLVLGATVLAFLGFATVYWISPLELHSYVDNSVVRVVSSIGVSCGILLPLLLAEALGAEGALGGEAAGGANAGAEAGPAPSAAAAGTP